MGIDELRREPGKGGGGGGALPKASKALIIDVELRAVSNAGWV